MSSKLPISPLAPKSYPTMPNIDGIQLATAAAGIYQNRDDVLLVSMSPATQMAGVYTRSLTASAAIEWCRLNGSYGEASGLIVNSGNSNAFTGHKGKEAVQAITNATASALECDAKQVMTASTGVIGEPLPYEKITNIIPELKEKLSADGWKQAANAISTTDTFPKYLTATTKIDGVDITLNAIAKGSGMIAPDMATMLAYVFTDANINSDVLQSLLSRGSHRSFNCITVDSDTSTSDTLQIFATCKAKHKQITDLGDERLSDFRKTLFDLLKQLALQVVCDGEGATKLITINITGAEDNESARVIGMSIANSPLVKTAAAGEDPNWGRIVMAVGKSGKWADRDKLCIKIGDELVAKGGVVHPDYSEANAAKHMQNQHIEFSVDVGVGEGKSTVWTCDLTHNYIKINADYRS